MAFIDVFGYNIVAADQTKPAIESAIQGSDRLQTTTVRTSRQYAAEMRDMGRATMVIGISLTSVIGLMNALGMETGVAGQVLGTAAMTMTSFGGAVSMATSLIRVFGYEVNAAMGAVGIAVIAIGTLIAAYKALELAKKKNTDTDAIFTWGTRKLNYEMMEAQHILDGTKQKYNDLQDAIEGVVDATKRIKDLQKEETGLGWEKNDLLREKAEIMRYLPREAMALQNIYLEHEDTAGKTLDMQEKEGDVLLRQRNTYEDHLQRIQQIDSRLQEISERGTEINKPKTGELAAAKEQKNVADTALKAMGLPTLVEANDRLKQLKEGPMKAQEAAVKEVEDRIYNLKVTNEGAYFSLVKDNEEKRHETAMENILAENSARLGGWLTGDPGKSGGLEGTVLGAVADVGNFLGTKYLQGGE